MVEEGNDDPLEETAVARMRGWAYMYLGEALFGHTNLPLFSEVSGHLVSALGDPHEDASASAK